MDVRRPSQTRLARPLGLALTAAAVVLVGCNAAESRDAPEAGRSETAAASEAPPAPPTLAAGTKIAFRTDAPVSTETHAAGDVFTADVAMDVPGPDGTVILPSGTPARWEITQAGEGTDGRTILAFRLASLQVDGAWTPVNATVTSTDLTVDEEDSDTETAAKVAVGAAAGALVGQIIGKDTESTLKGAAAGTAMGTVVALSTRGGSARMDAGSLITVRLEAPLAAS